MAIVITKTKIKIKIKKLREIKGTVKDKASLFKAALSFHRSSLITTSIIKATKRGRSSEIPDYRISDVLFLGAASNAAATKCIDTVINRLRRSHDVFTALKCLILVHNIIAQGSAVLKDKLSFYTSTGSQNSLNLWNFQLNATVEIRELSAWVRWYGAVLDRNLVVSRILGFYFSSSVTKSDKKRDSESVLRLSNSNLIGDIEILVSLVEEISSVPNSLHLQRKEIVYQLVRLVGDDYRLIQYQISIRFVEFDQRLGEIRGDELGKMMDCVKRIENCRQRLRGLFVNRYRNDDLWDLIRDTGMKVKEMKEERENGRLLRIGSNEEDEDKTGSSRFGKRASQLGRLTLAVW